MLKIKILIIIFCCIGVVKAQTVIPPSSETPPGWIYYDGDEFNGDVIDLPCRRCYPPQRKNLCTS